MDGVESGLKQRVNGNMLPQLQGQSVCLLGIAKNVDTNGISFTLTTTDNVDVQINMREPLNEYVAGLTEVHGEVGPQNNVMCSNYVVFPEEAASNFDLELYNTAVETVARFPNHYITSAT